MLNKELIEDVSDYIYNNDKSWIPLFFNNTSINDFGYEDIVISSDYDGVDQLRYEEMFFSDRIPSNLRDEQWFSPTMGYLKKMKIKPSLSLLDENMRIQEYLDDNDKLVAKCIYFPEEPKTYLFLVDKKHLFKILKSKNLFLKIYILIRDEQLIKYFVSKNLFGLNNKNGYVFKENSFSKDFTYMYIKISLIDLLKKNGN